MPKLALVPRGMPPRLELACWLEPVAFFFEDTRSAAYLTLDAALRLGSRPPRHAELRVARGGVITTYRPERAKLQRLVAARRGRSRMRLHWSASFELPPALG